MEVLVLGCFQRRMRRQSGDSGVRVHVTGNQPTSTTIEPLRQVLAAARRLMHSARSHFLTILEFVAIGLLVLILGKDLIYANARWIPPGREFLSAIQTHQLWVSLKDCGWCFVWNGASDGGSPAFVDPYGSALNPIVAGSTLLFGVVGGAKIAVLVALMIAGIGQWWLSWALGVGRLARIWSTLAAVAGGHLAGRMEIGVVGIILAIAAGSLVYPAILMVVKYPSKGVYVALLALAIAMLFLSGQGYVQIGFLASLPALALILITRKLGLLPSWKALAIALGLSLLLASPFFVPLAHFLPQLGKDTDPTFASVQPLRYLPLNLVINDMSYYYSGDVLSKQPYPYLYTLYIGWVAVVCAIAGFVWGMRNRKREALYLGASVFLIFAFASGYGWERLDSLVPNLAWIRNPSLAAGLAVPLILGLAAWGVDWLWHLRWPTFGFHLLDSGISPSLEVSSRWLLLIPLVLGLRSEIAFSSPLLETIPADPQVQQVIGALKTPSLEWVAPPFGEHFFVAPSEVAGLKLTDGLLRWHWSGRDRPVAYLMASRTPPDDPNLKRVDTIGSVGVYLNHGDGNEYASVASSGGSEPCTSEGEAGEIHVHCSTEQGGVLTVEEHMYTGWKAWRDGQPVALLGGNWLAVQAPAGQHDYVFEYLPADVPIGMTLALIGLLCCLWVSLRHRADLSKGHSNRKLGT